MNLQALLEPFARYIPRAYRYDGEKAAHAEQLRETEVSLSLMASAPGDDPDQTRMASEIEHGAENRLSVLLGRPRLTMEEKRERDAIQAALAARRQAFDAPVLVERETPLSAPRRFLGTLTTANPWMAILFSPWTWLVVVGSFAALQTGRIGNLKDDVADLEADVAMVERHLADEREIRNRLTEEVRAADLLSQQTAANLEAERRRASAYAERERRRVRALREVDAGGDPPAWERSLRDDEPVAGPDSGSDGVAASGHPG